MARFVFIALLFIHFNLSAQQFTPSRDWRFENFNSQNHFISSEIYGITMDSHGYIWTCSKGVQRFDGYHTVDFNSFEREKGGLRSNFTNIIADGVGRIWVTSAGLCYYDNASGKFVYVDAGPQHPFAMVYALQVQKNYLWFICDHSLARLNLLSLKISFTSLNNIDNPLGTFVLDDHTLLISSREKVYIYNIRENTYYSRTLTYNHALLKIFAVTTSGSNIFLGTNIGLFALKNLREPVLLSNETKDLAIDDLTFLPVDKEKKYLFIATDGKGILVYNTGLKKVEFTYMHDDSNPGSLPDNDISKFYNDTKGRLWVGTDLGISLLNPFNQQWKMRLLNKSNNGDVFITRIAQDKTDSSKVWMSSYDQGMIRIDWKTKQIEKVVNTDADMDRLFDFVQLPGNKWLLATQKQVMEWSPGPGILSKKDLPLPDSLKLGYIIRRIIPTDAHTCFITTNRGLFKYDMLRHTVSPAAITSSNKTAQALKYDLLNGFYDNGVLWAASRNGLFSYNVAGGQTIIYTGKNESPDHYFFDITKAPVIRLFARLLTAYAYLTGKQKLSKK